MERKYKIYRKALSPTLELNLGSSVSEATLVTTKTLSAYTIRFLDLSSFVIE